MSGMHELVHDPFYTLLREYDRCVIDYCLIGDDAPYRGMRSHKEAVLFAMLRIIERDIESQREDDAMWGSVLSDDLYPWSLDFGKAKAAPLDPEAFLLVPEVVRVDKSGRVRYDRGFPDGDAGGQIPYWYAFLETPHGTGYRPDDFRRINAALFPKGADALEVYEWSTDWSSYFDEGHEWWGAACWSVYDRQMDRYVVLLASTTD